MRAVGYVRVSREEQDKEGNALEGQASISLAAQRAKLIAYASLYEVELVPTAEAPDGVLEDAGVSARTLDRPALRRAFDLIDRGQVDGILITKLDRITRSVTDWGDMIKKYFSEKKGKQLWSIHDAIDTRTATGRLVLNLLISVSEWEREAIAERTSEALQHKIKKGERVGKVRYGFVIDPSDARLSQKTRSPNGLVVAPAEAEAIALMTSLAASGASLRGIARSLTARGIATKEGRPAWDHTTVRQILARGRARGRVHGLTPKRSEG